MVPLPGELTMYCKSLVFVTFVRIWLSTQEHLQNSESDACVWLAGGAPRRRIRQQGGAQWWRDWAKMKEQVSLR